MSLPYYFAHNLLPHTSATAPEELDLRPLAFTRFRRFSICTIDSIRRGHAGSGAKVARAVMVEAATKVIAA